METPEFFFTFGNGFIYIFGHAMWGLSSQIRGRSCAAAVESQSLNHCNTRDVPRDNDIYMKWSGYMVSREYDHYTRGCQNT